jgi:hypothetical protein
MADCEKLEKCPFFNDKMADMPTAASMYKENYCKKDFEKCARLMVAKKLGSEKVPADLFPNQTDRALELINA